MNSSHPLAQDGTSVSASGRIRAARCTTPPDTVARSPAWTFTDSPRPDATFTTPSNTTTSTIFPSDVWR
ncbi:hypothetical protein D3C80_1514330 [compost metagenome]